MRIISWNVNGVRAITGKIKNGDKIGSATHNTVKTLIEEQMPDILCFQEVKTQNEGDLTCFRSNFKYIFTNFAKLKKGYSGVTLMCNIKPKWISYDFQMYSEDQIGPYRNYAFNEEGRIITARFEGIVVVTVYVPNAQAELARIDDRLEWEAVMRRYLKRLEEDEAVPVVLIGDLNVAPDVIDIHDNKNRERVAGASKEERAEYKKLLEAGFVNAFRHLHPNERKYSYFSNFAGARQRNKGWLIDHCLVSAAARDKIVAADVLDAFHGSDHTPILIDIAK